MKMHYNDTQQLISGDKALLSVFFYEQLALEKPTEKLSCLSQVPIAAASTVAIGSGFASWFPIIVGTMKIGIKNKEVRVILTGGSWTSYGGLYAWGTLEIVQDLFKKRLPSEQKLLENHTNPCLDKTYKATVLLMGLAGALPNAYFAYIFNNKNIPWTAVNILGSWGICCYAFHNMIAEWKMGLISTIFASCAIQTRQCQQVKDFINARLTQLINRLPSLESDTIKSYFTLEDQETRSDLSIEEHMTLHFFEKLILNFQEEDSITTLMGAKKIQYPIKGASLLVSASNIFANGLETWLLGSRFTTSKIAKTVATALSMTSSYISYSINRDCYAYFTEKAIRIWKKQPIDTVASVQVPTARKVLIATASTLSLLSLALDWAMAKQVFPEETPLGWAEVGTSMANNLAMTTLPMVKLSLAIVDLGLMHWGSEDTKYKLKMTQRLEFLQTMISKSSNEEVIRLLHLLFKSEQIETILKDNFTWYSSEQIV